MSAYHRQPYLSGRTSCNGKWTSVAMEMQSCIDSDCPLRESDSQHRLNMSPTGEQNTLPDEKPKTLVCCFACVLVLVLNVLSTAIIHDRTPNVADGQSSHPPLRDISFDATSYSWTESNTSILLTISEILLVTSTVIVFGLILLHEHKSIVFRRLFFMLFLLFTARLLTMNATMLPISSTKLYRCDEKRSPSEMGVVTLRFFEILVSWGLSSASEMKFCGNYIYSGHTTVVVLNYLVTDEYCPSLTVNIAVKIMTLVSVLLLLVSQYDYTVSVIIAYYITTRLFWLYHTLANNPSLKKLNATNQICKEWWYPIFQFLEGNVHEVVPPRFKFLR